MWGNRDFPSDAREARRPLPFDDALEPKPMYDALLSALEAAPEREPLWTPPRAG